MRPARCTARHFRTSFTVAALGLTLALPIGCAFDAEPELEPTVAPDPGGKADGATSTNRLLEVAPLLQTTWGQSDDYQARTPRKDGRATYPGCTTVASAQVLYYYQYQNHANSAVYYGLEHAPLAGPDVVDDGSALSVDLPGYRYDFDAMALSLDHATAAQVDATATFIYHVGASLNSQFGGGEGTSATGKQIENAFRYQWGFNNISRRKMSVISKDAFGYDDGEWVEVVKAELAAGRPVLYMAQQVDADAGHAFVIDGYDRDGLFHVNWGWGGHGNGYYDLNVLEDPSNRRWTRGAMIFRGLEPEEGYAAAMTTGDADDQPLHSWHGNSSLISYSSGTATGYGLTEDEARIHPGGAGLPVVFLQWEVDRRDGARLEIAADGMATASITYGIWSDRQGDRLHPHVSLPFVLDPSADGFEVADGEYFTIAVAFDQQPSAPVTVTARPTGAAATEGVSVPGLPVAVGDSTWHGNGSLISYSSGTATGYGLTLDEARIHPGGAGQPAVFFQWEVDSRDGRAIEIAAAGMSTATITYGSWDDRSNDVTRTVQLPFVLDPSADDRSVADGDYLVVRVRFPDQPSQATAVTATIVSP